MRKSTVASIAAFTMILFLVIMTPDHVAQAMSPEVEIQYPNASLYEGYHNPTPIKISVYYLDKISSSPIVTDPQIVKITYNIDDASNVTLTNFELSQIPYSGYAVSVTSTAYNLTEGDHIIHAYAFCANGEVLSGRTIFSVNSSTMYPPFTHLLELGMSILSPLNQTYNLNGNNQLPLTYAIEGGIKIAYYQLDDSPNQYANFFEGNTTLLNVPDGSHKIQIWAITERGNTTQTAYFTVNTAQTETVQPTDNQADNTSNNTIFAAVIVAFASVTILTILLLKRRKT
jgi:hypothetical protein